MVRVGQRGEAAVRGVASIVCNMPIHAVGGTRIADAFINRGLSEVKNVKSQSYTEQLKYFATHARANGQKFDLWVRPNTQLSGPLAQEVANGAIRLRTIP